jgi:pilus assembly protein CpaF
MAAPMAPAMPAPAPMAAPQPAPAPMAAPLPPAMPQPAPAPMAAVARPPEPAAPRTQARPHAAARGTSAALFAVVSEASRSFSAQDILRPLPDGDPRREAARRAVEVAVDAVSSRGMTIDRGRIAAAALDELLGLGALGALLGAGGARGISIHGPESVSLDQGEGLVPTDAAFSSSEALSLIVGRLVTLAGGSFDRGATRHEGLLPSGFHFSAVMPPVAVGGPVVELRRVSRTAVAPEQLVARGVLSTAMAETLRRAVAARRSVLVIGPSDAGVSTLLSALAGSVPESERLVVVEAAPALELDAPRVVRLAASGGLSLEQLVGLGVGLRGDRLLIDGVRGLEALTALTAAASRSGSLVGVHSVPAGDAYGHLCALAQLGGASADALARVLPSAASVLVRLGLDAGGHARVESMAEVRASSSGAQVTELFGPGFAAAARPSF